MVNEEFHELMESEQRQYREYVKLDEDMYCYTVCAFWSEEKFSPAELQILY
jgi:hypothetical protein